MGFRYPQHALFFDVFAWKMPRRYGFDNLMLFRYQVIASMSHVFSRSLAIRQSRYCVGIRHITIDVNSPDRCQQSQKTASPYGE